MPYSIVHSELALETEGLFGFDDTQFQEYLVGNIFVDCSHLLEEAGYHIRRSETHYYDKCDYETIDFPEEFCKQEGLSSHFKQGYYFHLLTDKVWRDSAFVRKAYVSQEEERLYQISRKLYAYRDYLSLIENPISKSKVEKLYDFSFSRIDLPFIYRKVPVITLDKTLYGILDFMLLKKIFVKKVEKESDYEMKEGRFCLKDTSLQKLVEKNYPFETYKGLKEESLAQFKSKMRS